MTLLDLYEPLFQYVCMLNRIARGKVPESIECDALRKEITALIDSLDQSAQAYPLLAMQAKKLRMPILFFVDSIIAESKLQCAPQWHMNRLAYAENELAGDEKFFDCVEEALADPSPEATERLVFFYVCMGLGFVGWYGGQPEYLRRKMETIAKRISDSVDIADIRRICPEAYQYLDTRNLIEPPSSKIGAMLIAFLALSLIVFAVNFYLFKIGSIGLTESLREILRHDLMQ